MSITPGKRVIGTVCENMKPGLAVFTNNPLGFFKKSSMMERLFTFLLPPVLRKPPDIVVIATVANWENFKMDRLKS